MLTESKTITPCINMITYHDGGVLTRESEGFQGHCPGVHTNDFIEINIKLGMSCQSRKLISLNFPQHCYNKNK